MNSFLFLFLNIPIILTLIFLVDLKERRVSEFPCLLVNQFVSLIPHYCDKHFPDIIFWEQNGWRKVGKEIFTDWENDESEKNEHNAEL